STACDARLFLGSIEFFRGSIEFFRDFWWASSNFLRDQEITLFLLNIKAKLIPSVVAFISVSISLFMKDSLPYIPIILFGNYIS
ncbi:Os04g0173300, partial [Oryza sativa Japonica Group]